MLIRLVGEQTPGIFRYELNLAQLYIDPASRKAFNFRWEDFQASDQNHSGVFELNGDTIAYSSESFLPPSGCGRPRVLLLLGNPASQSVNAGMCFAFERGSGGEHRFWQALRQAGWLAFPEESVETDCAARNDVRRHHLLGGSYDSPFSVGIDVFFTFPSPASAPRWSGVAGLYALFGRRPLRQIVEWEQRRLAATVARYMPDGGTVVAFQRDAYEGMRTPSAPEYAAEAAKAGMLSGRLAGNTDVRLIGAPPTRLAHSRAFKAMLTRSASHLGEVLR